MGNCGPAELPPPEMRATSESLPRFAYAMSFGKSCAGFSKVTVESVMAVLRNSVVAWRDGDAM
jgi:hypothetical protein